MKKILLYIVFLSCFASASSYSQKDIKRDNIYMTWNAKTPESEMNDDIKALKEHGVTITYSDVKRNNKGEITAIKVDFAAENGAKGTLSLEDQKPIKTIKIYKQDGEVGFGEPENEQFNWNNFSSNNFNPNDMMKGFQFNGNEDGLPGQQFHFEFPEGKSFGKSSSKIIIKKDGKKPLVIQDGEVVEGGEDYTKEEIDEIKNNNKVESYKFDDMPFFNNNENNGFGKMQEQMQRMQEQIDELMKNHKAYPKTDSKNSDEELEKAKKELEEAKKELKKTKSSLKTQKA
jgi:hypothetical protein